MMCKLPASIVLSALLALGVFSAALAGPDEPEDIAFDAELAAELGADDYGMRRYVMVFLKSGKAEVSADEAAELQRGHMENIRRLAENGRLVLAGPFMGGGELRGIFVLDVETVEAARELTDSDPAIQAGLLRAEYQGWYGSAAIRKVGEIHERIARENP